MNGDDATGSTVPNGPLTADASTRDTRPPRVATLAVLLPTMAATVAVVLFILLEVAGREPISYGSPTNLAEAAGMGISSDVLRFLWQGQDPDQVQPVRPHIIASTITRVTALEAAIFSRRTTVVRVLEHEGALDRPEAREHVACLAVELRAEDILAYLAPDGVPGCDPEATVAGIEERSR